MPEIPGTFEPGFEPQPLQHVATPPLLAAVFKEMGALGLKCYAMGECLIMVAREPAGTNGERLWHLTISCEDRHPTWDEIKSARYRLLPHDLCFGMLLPPPQFYVNVPDQDHVFHMWEVTDPREPWSAG